MRTRRFGRTKVGRVFGGGAAVATAAILVATFTAIGTASASTASHHGHGPTHGHGHGHGISTCNNETLASGTYHNLRVRGTCTIPDGTSVTVEHNLVLEPNSQLKAVTASTVDVAGNILVRRGALLGLGCTLAMVKPVAGPPLCDNPSGGTVNPSNDVVGGNIVANHPLSIYLDGVTVERNVIVHGGGQPASGFTSGCEDTGGLNLPIKDDVIAGNLIVVGWQGCWFGIIRDQVGGNTLAIANITAEADSAEIVSNQIGRNLICFANDVAPQFGDSHGIPNVVGGQKIGQCSGL